MYHFSHNLSLLTLLPIRLQIYQIIAIWNIFAS
nr:MAG TPA: hypothetical protein [Caudoviricetes sp.]